MGRRSKPRKRQKPSPPRDHAITPAQRESPKEQHAPSIRVLEERREFFAGPLPRPSDLRAYEKIQAGFAERIIAMAERQVEMAETQSRHRQALESQVVRSRVRMETWGQVLAFILAFGVLGGAIHLLHLDKPITGLSTLLAGLGALIWVNRHGRRRQEREPVSKSDRLSVPQG